MASDVMRVRLHLRETRVLAVASDTPSELRVEVESTVRRPRCPACGFRCTRVHDTRRRKVRDLEVSGRRTTLVWLRRRFVCDNCGSRHLEDHPEFEGRLTRRLARRLVADARVMTLRAAARRHGLGWHLINGVVKAWSAVLAEHRRSRRCRVLLVDETSMRKRHRYVTVIVNGDTGQTLAMVEHRSSAALSDVSDATGPQMVQGRQSRRQRRLQGLQVRHRRPPRARPPRAGPLPRHQMVLSGAHRRCAATSSAALKAPSPPSTPKCSGPDSRCCARGDTLTDADRARLDALFDAHPRLKGRLAGPARTPRPLPRRRPPRLPRGPGTVLRPLRDRRAARVPRHRRHHHRPLRRDPQLAPHRPGPSNGRIEGTILWSVSEGVVDVADGHVAGCRGRVLWSVSLASAMLLAV